MTLDAAEIDWGVQGNTATLPGAADAAPIAERFSIFCSNLEQQVRPADVVPELVPGIGITMMHGQPRALKTWCLQEIARAVSTGDAVFGLERFRVPEPLAVWNLTEEDPPLDVRDRFVSLFAGRGQAPSDNLHVTVQKAVSLDVPESQAQIVGYGRRHRIKLTIFDPIRAVSGAVDQGPRELRPLALFLRYYMRETGSAVLLGHHDVKPLAGKPDDRAKPHRASGGGIFSIADAPIHAELIDEAGSQTLLTPSRYKFAVTPEPLIVAIEADDPKRPTWVRLQGKDTTAGEASTVVLHQKIGAFLREHPGTSSNKVGAGVRAEKARVLAALEQLLNKNEADYFQKGQTKHWSMRSTFRATDS